jgi:cellulose synthase operon protein C
VIRSTGGAKTLAAANAQLMIGETYYHQKNYDTALREYLKVDILYAFPGVQAAALLQAGKCHELLGEWKQAAEVYARLSKQYPDTSFAKEATQRLSAGEKRP